tara:strand:+ start:1445 stop:1801 length:357 start_codon:yes stop_codon:yes gene_type:complete
MKKITLSVALLASVLTLKAQDTSCTYFSDKDVYHFDYQQDTITSIDEQTTEFYEINIKHGDILCLDLSDKKLRVRKVITTFSNNSTQTQILDSKDCVYYSSFGVIKVLVGKPKLAIKL